MSEAPQSAPPTIHYQDDTITVWAGDCIEVLRDLPDASVDSVVTDPPYNLSFMAKPWDAYEGREDAGFAYWLTGLIDGEGHFGIKAHARGTHAPFFSLKMRADERGMLERVRRSLGVGTLTDEPHEPNPMVKYVIQDKAGCQRLVDLLDKYPLRAKKQIDYWTWREAVCEWTERPRGNRWHGRADNTRMANLRDRLMDTRAYADVPWSGHEFQDWCRLWATECLRVLKPGGHMLAFGGTRTSHRLACAIEDAGFEIRDSLAWLYGSGFPKSLDVGKAIDKAAGAVREVVGTYTPPVGSSCGDVTPHARTPFTGGVKVDGIAPGRSVTAPATDATKQWQGWGTALKPAHEPITVARKPLTGTVAANVQTHGTGALNVDASRIAGDVPQVKQGGRKINGGRFMDNADAEIRNTISNPHAAGRWPANVILDETQADTLDQQSGTLAPGNHPAVRNGERRDSVYALGHVGTEGERRPTEAGGASRFFYVVPIDDPDLPRFKYQAKAPAAERPSYVKDDGTKVAHPTVKPLALIRWLQRLVTPPDGTTLDLFAGSGTAVEAAMIEGFRVVAVENDPDSLPLIRIRIDRQHAAAAAGRRRDVIHRAPQTPEPVEEGLF